MKDYFIKSKIVRLITNIFLIIILSYGCNKGNNGNPWKILTSMPTARHNLGFVECSGLLYAIGGYNAGGSNKVEVYTPATDKWEVRASMPTARGYLVVASVSNKIYAIGGVTGGDLNNITYTNVTEEYDPSTNIWTVKAPFPNTALPPNSVLGNQFIAGAAINGKIYVSVGSSGGNGPTYIYNPVTNSWSNTGATIPRFNLEPYFSTTTNNEMYVSDGGFFLKYMPDANGWNMLQPFIKYRKGASLAAFENKVFSAGGYDIISNKVKMYDDAEIYNITGASWAKSSSLNMKRHSAASLVFDGKLYVAGGAEKQSNYSDVPVAILEMMSVR